MENQFMPNIVHDKYSTFTVIYSMVYVYKEGTLLRCLRWKYTGLFYTVSDFIQFSRLQGKRES